MTCWPTQTSRRSSWRRPMPFTCRWPSRPWRPASMSWSKSRSAFRSKPACELQARVRQSGLGPAGRAHEALRSRHRLRPRFHRGEIGEVLAVKAWYCDSTYRYTDDRQPAAASRLPASKALKPAGDPKANSAILSADPWQPPGGHRAFPGRRDGQLSRPRLVEKFGAYCWFVDVEFANGAIGHLDLTVAVRMDWHEGFQVYGEYGSVIGKRYNPWLLKSSDVECFSREGRPVSPRAWRRRTHLPAAGRRLCGHRAPRKTDARRDVEDGMASVRPCSRSRAPSKPASGCGSDQVSGGGLGTWSSAFSRKCGRRRDLDGTPGADDEYGIRHTQFNMSCVAPLRCRTQIPLELAKRIRSSLDRHRRRNGRRVGNVQHDPSEPGSRG